MSQTSDEMRAAVKERFPAVASSPGQEKKFPVGPDSARKLGLHPYKSHDQSRNNVVFGILALGEGWHNTHHAFLTSARHGLRWWQFQPPGFRGRHFAGHRDILSAFSRASGGTLL